MYKQAPDPQVSMNFDRLCLAVSIVKAFTGSFTFGESYVPLTNPKTPIKFYHSGSSRSFFNILSLPPIKYIFLLYRGGGYTCKRLKKLHDEAL